MNKIPQLGSEFTPVLLSDQELRSVLPIDSATVSRLVAALEHALRAYSTGGVRQPLRNAIDLNAQGSFLLSMPAFLPLGDPPAAKADSPALGVKIVTGCPGNIALGLPSHQATLLMFDPTTGTLRAILDAGYLTELRTATVSAISTNLLARPDAATLGIIGTGAQARCHANVFRCATGVRHIRAWSPSQERRTQFGRDLDVEITASAEDAVRDASVVLLATSAREPVVRSEWIRDGTHVISVGAPRPSHREIDPALLTRSRIWVDSRDGALSESGDLVLGLREGSIRPEDIVGELGELLAGLVSGRTGNEITVFKSLGMAVEDVAAGFLALSARFSYDPLASR